LNSQLARQPTKLAFHASRIVIDIGVLMVLGSMSLPFVNAGMGNRSALAADALPTLALLLPIFVITLLPDHSDPIPDVLGWLSLILAFAAFPYALIKYLDASTLADALGGSVGWGARLHVFGTFVVIAGIGIGLARNLLKLPVTGTYPSRPEARWIRRGMKGLGKKTGSAAILQPSPAHLAGPAPSSAEPAFPPAGGAAGPGPLTDTGPATTPVEPASSIFDAPTQVIPAARPAQGSPRPSVDDEATTEVVPIPKFPLSGTPAPPSLPVDAGPAHVQQPLIPGVDGSADEPDTGAEPGG